MIPNRFLFVWTGARFPYFARLAVESALVADPDARVEIHLFGDRPTRDPEFRNVATYDRVDIVDVEYDDVFNGLDAPASRYRDLLAQIPSTAYSAQSNLVRLGALHKRGGVYLDFDVIVRRDVRHLLDCDAFVGTERVWRADEARVRGDRQLWMVPSACAYAWAFALRYADTHIFDGRGVLEPLARPADGVWSTVGANNAVLGARPNAPFVRRLLASALAADPSVRFALGPTLVTRAIAERRDDVRVLPPPVFYAQPPSYSFRLFDAGAPPLPDEAVLIHYVSSNHGRRLRRITEVDVEQRAGRGPFYTLGADVATRARHLPRRVFGVA